MITKNEKMFNAMIESAAEDALKLKMDELPSCEELDQLYKPTQEMDLRINRIINKYYRVESAKKAFIFTGKIAAGLIILLIISGTVLLSVEASRNYILNSFLKWNSKHSTIVFSEDNNQNEFSKYSIEYIPEGFKLKSMDSDDVSQFITYINENSVSIHILETYADTVNLDVDNENNKQSELIINNNKAYLFETIKAGGSNILIWNDGNIAFEITSTISSDQLVLIGENILKK